MTELDRVLLKDRGPEPSPGFAEQVMTAVHADRERPGVSRASLVVLLGVFLTLVGIPLLVATFEGFQTVGGDPLSARLLWMVSLLVVTSIAAVVPMQLLER